MDIERAILGFTLAPLPILVPPMLWSMLMGAPSLVVPLFVIGYGATLSIGLPVHLTLTALKRQSLLAYLAGAATGILSIAGTFTAYSQWVFKPKPPVNPFALPIFWGQEGVVVTLVSLCLALVTAALFWVIGVRRPSILTRLGLIGYQQVEAVTPLTA